MLDVNFLRPEKGGDPVREREASARGGEGKGATREGVGSIEG